MPDATTDLQIPFASDTDLLSTWPETNEALSLRVEELIRGVPASIPPSQLQVAPSPTGTVTLNLVGDGSVATPHILSADSAMAFSDLTDVSTTDVPVDGDVAMWVTDHWEFRPPPVAPAGAVNVTPPLSGNGAVATPLALNLAPLALPSGVPVAEWGGAIPNTLGLPLYTDSAGQLRGYNALLTADDGKFTNATLGTKYPVGTSVLTVSSAAATSGAWPVAGASAIVLTIKRFDTTPANGAVAQYWISYDLSVTKQKMLYRVGSSTAWGAWNTLHSDTGWINGGTGSAVMVANGTNFTLHNSYGRVKNGVAQVMIDGVMKIASSSGGDAKNVGNIVIGTLAAAFRSKAPWEAPMASMGGGRVITGAVTGTGTTSGQVQIAAIGGSIPLAIGEGITLGGSYFMD